MNYKNKYILKILSVVQHFNYEKYWKMRDYLQDYEGGISVKACWYLFRVKRMDAFSNASTGVALGNGSAIFESHPRLPHGLYGIIIAPGAHIGKNVRICQQVTIGNDFKEVSHVPIIGDNVEIYPGAKIIGNISIGNNVKIGANAVVSFDVPDNSTVIVEKPRVILKERDG
jgi:serine O-acetyltransferase